MARPYLNNNEARFPAYPEPGPLLEEPTFHPNLAPVACAETRSNLALNNAAERVGTAVGSAVERVKQLPDRLQDMKQRFTLIRGRSQQDLKARASDVADDLKDQAQRTAAVARTRAERLSREQPLAVVAGAAVTGLILGIALRIWRDHAA